MRCETEASARQRRAADGCYGSGCSNYLTALLTARHFGVFNFRFEVFIYMSSG